jgi:PIN domain nuclease of toxin-antitoxin system
MFLLDTHLVLWAALEPARLSAKALRLLRARDNELAFSDATLWEVATKTSLRRPDFQVDPKQLQSALLGEGFVEVAILPEHVIRIARLPWIHRDPFDRMLVAQAAVEKHTLLTSDRLLAGYGKFVRVV